MSLTVFLQDLVMYDLYPGAKTYITMDTASTMDHHVKRGDIDQAFWTLIRGVFSIDTLKQHSAKGQRSPFPALPSTSVVLKVSNILVWGQLGVANGEAVVMYNSPVFTFIFGLKIFANGDVVAKENN